jgi:hypothetical protein
MTTLDRQVGPRRALGGLRLGLIAAALAALTGCNPERLVRKLAPTDVQEASERVLGDLRARRFDAIRGRLIAELGAQDLGGAFEEMAAAFPDEQPKAVTPVGYHAMTGTGGTKYDITYEYEFSRKWVVAQITWVRIDGELRIYGLHVNAHDASIMAMSAFTLKGKGAIHYAVLLAGILAAAISVVALVKCIRAPGVRRKWLWIIFILFGFGAFSLNWTTGQWQVQFFQFQLLSFSAFALFGQAWVIKVSVPIGALAFLDKLKREGRARKDAGAPPVLSQ